VSCYAEKPRPVQTNMSSSVHGELLTWFDDRGVGGSPLAFLKGCEATRTVSNDDIPIRPIDGLFERGETRPLVALKLQPTWVTAKVASGKSVQETRLRQAHGNSNLIW
jgi:hypothetical protein